MAVRRILLLIFLAGALAGCSPPPGPGVYAPPPLPQLSGVVRGQVEISGEVVLADDVRVPSGSSLRFAPGSLVWVRPAESTKIDPEYLSSLTEVLVEGRLVIAGNSAAPVRFLPLKATDPVPDGDPLWAGFELLPGATGDISGLEMARADVGLLIQEAEASLFGVRMEGCRYGVLMQDAARFTAEKFTVDEGEVGLFCAGSGILALAESRMQNLDEEGRYLASDGTVRLHGVSSSDNGVGLVGSARFLPGLELSGNRRDRVLLGGGL